MRESIICLTVLAGLLAPAFSQQIVMDESYPISIEAIENYQAISGRVIYRLTKEAAPAPYAGMHVLTLARSFDAGRTWEKGRRLHPTEWGIYYSVRLAAEGPNVYVAYSRCTYVSEPCGYGVPSIAASYDYGETFTYPRINPRDPGIPRYSVAISGTIKRPASGPGFSGSILRWGW